MLSEKKRYVSFFPERQSLSAFISLVIITTLASPLSIWWGKSFTAYLSLIALGMGIICAAISWWRSYLVRKEYEELTEREKLKKEYDREDLFQDTEDTMKLAELARKQFDRLGIPVLTLIMALGLGIGCGLILRYYGKWLTPEQWPILLEKVTLRDPIESLGFAVCAMLVTLIVGVYWNGVSREKGCQFLHPVGQWVIFSSVIYGVVAFLMILETAVMKDPEFFHLELDRVRSWDLLVGKFVCYGMIAFAIQMFLNFIIDFYRPRRAKEELKPLYESRLLGLLTEPGNVIKNISHTLNYQFGIQVSESWLICFIEYGCLPFIYTLFLVIYLWGCVVLVNADEMAIVTVFGRIHRVLLPGIHFKFPWPIARTYLEKVKDIRILNVGYYDEYDATGKIKFGEEVNMEGPESTQGDPTRRTIVWGKHHHSKETRFLMPARIKDEDQPPSLPQVPIPKEQILEGVSSPPSQLPAIDLVSLNVICGYKIRSDDHGQGLRNYLFNYRHTPSYLQYLIQQELIKLISSTSLLEFMTTQKLYLQKTLEERVKDQVTRLTRDPSMDLGVEILYIVIPGIHPPVPVARAFQNVVTAQQERDAIVYQALSEYHQIIGEAESRQAEILAEAESYRFAKITIPETEVMEYQAQLKNFLTSPAVFKTRMYLNELEKILANEDIIKYLVFVPNATRLTWLAYKQRIARVEHLDTEQKDY